MYDKIKVKKDSVQVHGVYPPAVPLIAHMWNRAYGGRVIDNLQPIHYNVAYFDLMFKELEVAKRAMDMAVEMGYNTMEISRWHTSQYHRYPATDLYFYKSDDE